VKTVSAWLALALLAAACGGRPSQSDCERATDHMIDIFAAPRVPGGSVPTDLAQAAEAWKKGLKEKDPVRGNLIDTCRHQMTGTHVSCILNAVDEVGLAKCFEG
jgi:hypothetical protein